jgi:hypothetical protein
MKKGRPKPPLDNALSLNYMDGLFSVLAFNIFTFIT